MTRKYIMDKNSKKWDKIKEIEVVEPVQIIVGIPISPKTPESYMGQPFKDFWDDSIDTESKPITKGLRHLLYPW